jgi:sulfate/thiosulfate transport system permease protein
LSAPPVTAVDRAAPRGAHQAAHEGTREAARGEDVAAVPRRKTDSRADPAWVRRSIITITVGFLGIFVVLPLACVFQQAFGKGVAVYFAALVDPDTLAAVRLTLLVAAIAVAANVVFGLIGAWAITKF